MPHARCCIDDVHHALFCIVTSAAHRSGATLAEPGGPESSEAETAILRRVGARARARRIELGWTWNELAQRSGLSVRSVADVEAGRGNLALTRLSGLARALGLDPGALVAEGTPAVVERPIALVGLRGAGKTTLGRRLAQRLGWPFIELDSLVEERAGLSLGEVFAMHGEAWHRRLEAACVRDLLDGGGPAVVALSGGVVSNPEPWAALKARARTIWLRARPDEHMERVLAQGDRRPMAGRRDAMAELRALLAAREPLYREASLRIDTGGIDVDAAFDRLLTALEDHGSPLPEPAPRSTMG